jgi:hypothetical protein
MTTRPRLLTLLIVLVAILAGCGPGGDGDDGPLAVYRRVAGGTTEETTVYADGRVLMKHGEYVERFTVPAEDVEQLRAALQAPAPTGAPGDGLERSLTLPDGTVVESPLPEEGTAAGLLERLTSTHSLAEDAPAATHAGDR